MKRPSTLCALAAVLGLGPASAAVVAVAQDLEPQDRVSVESSAVPVELRTDAGSVEFLATGWPSALKIHGKGAGPDGVLTIADHTVSGSLVVDLESLQTGIGLRDRHLKEEYLQVDRFPQARLTLSRLDVACVPEGAAFAPVAVPFDGTLMLHGVSKPVSGQARVGRHDARVDVSAQFSIKLGDFGVEIPKYMGITVAEKVDVKTTFSANLGPGSAVARR
jgi:polyisoprenoid-binding protein YceI